MVIAPVGFLADHVETLYDLDIEARQIAESMGLWMRRAQCPNASEGMIRAIEGVARRLIGAAQSADLRT